MVGPHEIARSRWSKAASASARPVGRAREWTAWQRDVAEGVQVCAAHLRIAMATAATAAGHRRCATDRRCEAGNGVPRTSTTSDRCGSGGKASARTSASASTSHRRATQQVAVPGSRYPRCCQWRYHHSRCPCGCGCGYLTRSGSDRCSGRLRKNGMDRWTGGVAQRGPIHRGGRNDALDRRAQFGFQLVDVGHLKRSEGLCGCGRWRGTAIAIATTLRGSSGGRSSSGGGGGDDEIGDGDVKGRLSATALRQRHGYGVFEGNHLYQGSAPDDAG